MQYYHHLEKVGITTINFKKIFAVAQVKFINDCNTYGLLKNSAMPSNASGRINLKSKDTKRLLMHHIIYEVCEEILECKSKFKVVIFYRPLEVNDTFEILQYCKVEELNSAILKVIKSMKKVLPIQIAIVDSAVSFHSLKEEHSKGTGESIELVYKILCHMTAINMSFEAVKKFVRKNKLTFLSKDYFNKVRTKQLFF
jgi:hypothetical protein